MKISRVLKIHSCNKCACILTDEDFTALGVNLRARLQYFFDYTCPRCAHRGRYNVDLNTEIRLVRALHILADQIIDEDDSRDERIDWDAIKWE